jgi:hypothetical protein
LTPTTTSLLLLFCLGHAQVARAADDAKSDLAAVRSVVTRSLPFLEQRGVAWITQRGCVSCHQTSFLIWTHVDARRRGFAVDENKLNAWTSWALLSAIVVNQGGTPQGADTLAQLLLGREARSWAAMKPTQGTRNFEPYENLVKDLLAAQTPDGSWKAAGQSKNPPETATGWSILALTTRDNSLMKDAAPDLERLVKSNDERSKQAIDRARAWLKTVKEDPQNDLTEQIVVRVLLEKITGGPPDLIAKRQQDLVARQGADGGWSVDPKLHQPSDAFATGMALYAIAHASPNVDSDPHVTKARDFLRTTQQPDGSWRVPTTAFHPLTGRPRDARTDDVYTYWGTAWATLGLLQTMPTPSSN